MQRFKTTTTTTNYRAVVDRCDDIPKSRPLIQN